MKADLKVDAFLHNVPLFKDVSADEIGRIAHVTKMVHAPRGQTLFHKGDAVHGFHILVYGQVKLAFTSPSGVDKVVEILGPGMGFGEALMFLERPAVVYAQAIADSMLLFVPRQAVFEELERNPSFGRRMLGGLSRRLHGLVMDVEAYSLCSGAQRVIGSSRRKRPSSKSISAAVDVMGFVIEAMRKMVSRVIGSPAAMSRQPTHATSAPSPSRHTSATAPASFPASTTAPRAAAIGSCSCMANRSCVSKRKTAFC